MRRIRARAAPGLRHGRAPSPFEDTPPNWGSGSAATPDFIRQLNILKDNDFATLPVTTWVRLLLRDRIRSAAAIGGRSVPVRYHTAALEPIPLFSWGRGLTICPTLPCVMIVM